MCIRDSLLLVSMVDCSARQAVERDLETLLAELRAGDVLLTLGAGDGDQVGRRVLAGLQSRATAIEPAPLAERLDGLASAIAQQTGLAVLRHAGQPKMTKNNPQPRRDRARNRFLMKRVQAGVARRAGWSIFAA